MQQDCKVRGRDVQASPSNSQSLGSEDAVNCQAWGKTKMSAAPTLATELRRCQSFSVRWKANAASCVEPDTRVVRSVCCRHGHVCRHGIILLVCGLACFLHILFFRRGALHAASSAMAALRGIRGQPANVREGRHSHALLMDLVARVCRLHLSALSVKTLCVALVSSLDVVHDGRPQRELHPGVCCACANLLHALAACTGVAEGERAAPQRSA